MASAEAASRPLRLEWVEAGTLDEHPRNWRRHPEDQQRALQSALSTVGWAGALLFNETTGRLLDGHARRRLVSPDTVVPVLIGRWDEQTELRILATLDPIGDMAQPDPVALGRLLERASLPADLRDATSDLQAQADRAAAGTIRQDEPPPAPRGKPKCKRGQCWKLGRNRLLISGDTSWRSVNRLVGRRPAPTITITAGRGPDRLAAVLRSAPGPVAYVWTAAGTEAMAAGEAMTGAGYELRNQIVLAHAPAGADEDGYRYEHAACWYGVKRGQQAHWIGGHAASTLWTITTDNRPAPEDPPIEAMALAIGNHAGSVFDPRADLGATLMAAEQLRRKWYGIEDDPVNADRIIRRWERWTSGRASKAGTND